MEIVYGVVGFTVVILSLVAILMVARKYLVSSGDVKIEINEDPEHTLTTAAGGTLLNTLASNKICDVQLQSIQLITHTRPNPTKTHKMCTLIIHHSAPHTSTGNFFLNSTEGLLNDLFRAVCFGQRMS